jgi:hypothetical protein
MLKGIKCMECKKCQNYNIYEKRFRESFHFIFYIKYKTAHIYNINFFIGYVKGGQKAQTKT